MSILARFAIVVALLLPIGTPSVALPSIALAACANPVACENALPGNPSTEWDVTGTGDPSIQGFATDISFNLGDTVNFKINTPATAYSIDIYRLGYYQGNGARKITSVTPSASLPQAQPACLSDAPSGLIDCGNWGVSASWVIPSAAVSGIYIARLVRPDTGGASHVVFTVRDDSSHSPVLMQASDTTWQAYNNYGGNSLYVGTAPSADGRAYKVSYNRPFFTRTSQNGLGSLSWVFGEEYPMLRFLEGNGYDVSYSTATDSDRRGSLLLNHKTFLSVGHDEYWSAAQRANVEAARAAGVNLAFFSGNELFWKTRWDPSIDSSSTPNRTLASYKETHANAVIDPSDPPTATATWRDPRFGAPADGGRPENALSGTMFMVNCCQFGSISVPAADGKMRIWRNTPVASLAPGQTATLGTGVLGHEFDADVDNGFRPAGEFELSTTTVNNANLLLDYGSSYTPASSTATHHMTLYRYPSGALVFAAGTVQWPWGLDAHHDHLAGQGTAADASLQQATVNLLADMGAQASTIQAPLQVAAASNDATAPTSSTTSPTSTSHLTVGSKVTVSGTAADAGGGVVGGVEVSVDGGTTWHPATGRENWTYTWNVGSAPGSVTIKSRAVDDSANLEVPGAGVAVTVDPISNSCNCTLWSASATPSVVDGNDSQAVEIGVKFRSDISGFIAGIRFYKAATNTGTHTGSLWDNTGHAIASATFSGETASGWQQVVFPAPVAIAANTTYVASYHTNVGHYSSDESYFGYAGVDTYPLHALKSRVDGPNGVFKYSSGSTFPNQSFNDTNYWVDVIFDPTNVDTVPPTVTGFTPAATATGTALDASVTATFSEDVQPSTISFVLTDPSNAVLASTVTYNQGTTTATLRPTGALALGTTYTATVSGARDIAGNPMPAPASSTFSTPACPCSLWTNATTPSVVNVNDPTQSVEVGTRFHALLDGFVTDIRFYKGPANTGTHTGHLWSASGTLLGSVTFGNESASGWQQATLGSPVAVTANTDYVVSYHMDASNYAADAAYFATSNTAVGPLEALKSSSSQSNGVFGYGPSAFPAQTFNATNYWVDVLFNTSPGGVSPVISGVQATQLASGGATIVWTTNVPTSSLVQYGTTSAYGAASNLNMTMVTAHSVQLNGLTPSTLYHYRVLSKDSSGTLGTSGDFTFTTPAVVDAPPIISAVQVTNITSSAATVGWTTDKAADTQVVYGLTASYGSSTTLDTTLVTGHSQTLTSLKPSTLYHYQVKSKDASGTPAASPDATFTTAADTTPPVISAVQASQITMSGAGISWTTDKVSDSLVNYGTTAAYGSSTPQDTNLVTSHAQMLTGLQPSTTYHYQVISKDKFGNQAVSADASFVTLADTTPPVISNVTAINLTSSGGTITWSTNKPSDSQVEYGTTTSYGTLSPRDATLTTTHILTLTGLAPATTYHYRVDSRDAAGNIANSTDATLSTAPDTVAPSLSVVQATNVTSNGATIVWTSSEVATSQVEYGTTVAYGTSTTLNSTLVTSHSVVLSGLFPNTTYHYRVKSKDGSGNLATSSDFTFTSGKSLVPPVISNVQAGSITTTAATITWTTDETSDTQVDYGTTASYGTSSALNSTLVNSHTVALTGLTANTLYHYRVKSKDNSGNPATSADNTFTTLPLPHSIALNGASGFAEAPNASELNVTSSWTVEAWFKDTTPGGYEHFPTQILSKGDILTDREVPFAVGIAFNSLYVVEKTNNVPYFVYYDLEKNKVSDTSWHHVAVTLAASTRQVTLYLDGVQVLQGTFSAVTTAGNSKAVDIGRNGAPTGQGYWSGGLDDVRIWNVARTAAQISANYRTELAGAQPGLVGNWKFDEGSGATAADTTGTPQGAALSGGYSWSTDVHP